MLSESNAVPASARHFSARSVAITKRPALRAVTMFG